jgi:hypothetical protein
MKEFLPYLPVLIAAVFILRRAGQVQKVNTGRMWIRPVFLILLLMGALAAEPFPGVIAMSAFVLAAVAGAALGYYMASHQHLSIHPETGQLESRTSTIGTFLVLGLFAVRFGAKLVFPDLANPDHHHVGQMTAATNGLLVFTVAVLVTRTVAVWRRTRPLVAGHAAKKALGTAAGPDGGPPAVTGENPAEATAHASE